MDYSGHRCVLVLMIWQKGEYNVAQQDLGQGIKGARETYAGFIALFKWGAVVCALVAALVIVLIS